MRHKRNFRGQAGAMRTRPSLGIGRETPFTCVCQVITIDDFTGTPQSSTRICVGTATEGVLDCSCCEIRRAEGTK